MAHAGVADSVARMASAVFRSIAIGGILCSIATQALALGPKPEPLKENTEIKVAFLKTGFVAPLIYVPEILKSMNIEYKGIEFQRYADTRSAISSKAADVGLTGGTLLVQALATGNENLIALLGVAGEKIYPVVRKGVEVKTWDDLKGKKIGAGVGGNVWTQWIAKLIQVGLPYGDLDVTGIQGGGQNYNIALKRGDIDVAILWSPFNTMPVVDGYAYWPMELEFSMSQPVGGEQGMWMVHKEVLSEKRPLIDRFLWAYKAAEERINKDNATKAEAIHRFTGIKMDVATELAKLTIFGQDATVEKLQAMAKLMAEKGIVKSDVSAQIPAHFNTEVAKQALGE